MRDTVCATGLTPESLVQAIVSLRRRLVLSNGGAKHGMRVTSYEFTVENPAVPVGAIINRPKI